jgi:hypothetical protein
VKRGSWISPLFYIAALYDGALGLSFLVKPGAVFRRLGVTPPNHPGYVQFPAALLIIFTLIFLRIAADPAGNRGLIPYGILLKLSYCGIVFYYWPTGDLSWIWKPFAVCDLAFLILFVRAFLSPGARGGAGVGGAAAT